MANMQNWSNFLGDIGTTTAHEGQGGWAPGSCIAVAFPGRSMISCNLISEASTGSKHYVYYKITMGEDSKPRRAAQTMPPIDTAGNSHFQTRMTQILLPFLFKLKVGACVARVLHPFEFFCNPPPTAALLSPCCKQVANILLSCCCTKIQGSSCLSQVRERIAQEKVTVRTETDFCQVKERCEVTLKKKIE